MSVAWVGAAAAVAGAAMSASASKSAAKTQANSARDANELQRQQFEAVRSDLEPYRDYGSGATNLLSQYLGITPSAGSGSGSGDGTAGAAGGNTLSGAELVSTAGGVPTFNHDLYGSNEAYRNAWDGLAAQHQGQFGEAYSRYSDPEQIRKGLLNRLAPNLAQEQADAQAAVAAQAQSPNFGALLKNFTGDDLANEPGYQFGLQQGQQGIDRRAAAGGNYFSGAALKGAARFGNDYASTKFGEAFNRDSANKTRIYNFLSGGASLGQNAAAQTGNAGQAMAQQVGANTMGAANASGAAGIASANSLSNGVSSLAGAYNQNQLVNKIIGGNAGLSSSSYSGTGPSPYAGDYGLGPSFNQYAR